MQDVNSPERAQQATNAVVFLRILLKYLTESLNADDLVAFLDAPQRAAAAAANTAKDGTGTSLYFSAPYIEYACRKLNPQKMISIGLFPIQYILNERDNLFLGQDRPAKTRFPLHEPPAYRESTVCLKIPHFYLHLRTYELV